MRCSSASHSRTGSSRNRRSGALRRPISVSAAVARRCESEQPRGKAILGVPGAKFAGNRASVFYTAITAPNTAEVPALAIARKMPC